MEEIDAMAIALGIFWAFVVAAYGASHCCSAYRLNCCEEDPAEGSMLLL